jgi:hypothetical protein
MFSGAVLFPYSQPYWRSGSIPIPTLQSPKDGALHDIVKAALDVGFLIPTRGTPLEKLNRIWCILILDPVAPGTTVGSIPMHFRQFSFVFR